MSSPTSVVNIDVTILSLSYIDIRWYWNALQIYSYISYRRSPRMDNLLDSFEDFAKLQNGEASPCQSL